MAGCQAQSLNSDMQRIFIRHGHRHYIPVLEVSEQGPGGGYSLCEGDG